MQKGWNSNSKVAALALGCLALVLAVEAGTFVGAGSMATVQGGRSMSQAAAGVFAQPQVTRVTTRRSTRADEAKRARQRKAKELRQTLVQMEAVPSHSVAECDDWARLNDQYNRLTGLAARRMRQNEVAKAKECDALHFALDQTRARFDKLRRLFEAERGQVGFVGGLLAEYLDLTHRVAQDETLAKSYLDMVRDESEVGRGVQNLEQLLEFVREQTRGDSRAEGDSLDELSERVKQLVYREDQLDDERLRQLNELTEELERALANGRHVPVESGRFRYLSGVLDAARAVLVHKLSEHPVEVPQFETTFETEQSEQAPVEDFLDEFHENDELPQGSYAFAGAYSNRERDHEEAEREEEERERAERDEAERQAAADKFRNSYEQPKSARAVVSDVLAQAERAAAEADSIRAARQANKVVAAGVRAAAATEQQQQQQQQAPQQPLVQAVAATTNVAGGQALSEQQVRSQGPNSVNDLVSRLRQRQFSVSAGAKASNNKFD